MTEVFLSPNINYPFEAELHRIGPMMEGRSGPDITYAEIIDEPRILGSEIWLQADRADQVVIVEFANTGHLLCYIKNDFTDEAWLNGFNGAITMHFDDTDDNLNKYAPASIAWDDEFFPKLMTDPSSHVLMMDPFYLPVVPTAGIFVPVEPNLQNYGGTSFTIFQFEHEHDEPVEFAMFPTHSCTLADVRTAWIEWFQANKNDSSRFITEHPDPKLCEKLAELNSDDPLIKKFSPSQLKFVNDYYLAFHRTSLEALCSAPTSDDGAKMGWQGK